MLIVDMPLFTVARNDSLVERLLNDPLLNDTIQTADPTGAKALAYFIGGLGMTALTANNIVVVPIRSGLGLRLGANIGYLKFTPQPTWNPF